jgi:hypothetical protein
MTKEITGECPSSPSLPTECIRGYVLTGTHTSLSVKVELVGVRGSVLVQALRYKPEGRGFEIR